MSKRFDVMAPRPGREEGKTFWHRVGTAWEGEKGIGIEFDSLPIPDKEGKVKVRLFEPREKPQTQERVPGSAKTPVNIDDDIPF